MRTVPLLLAACGLAMLAGCADDDGDSGYYRGGGGYVADERYDMSYDEAHRRWWAEHQHDRTFEERLALREHRRFCDRYPEDSSCTGWYHH